MSNIYTSIDIGSYSIKVVVLQKVGNKFNTLATTSVRSKGIERGRVINEEDLIKSIKSAIDSVSNIIGIKIDKVLLAISAKDAIMDIIPAQVDITNDKVSGDDISNLLRDAVSGQSFVKNELVTAFPIKFKVDGVEYSNAKGVTGDKLSSRVVISVTPKNDLYNLFRILKRCGVDVVDIMYTSTGDYYAIQRDYSNKVGAIINIGYLDTNVSVFNRGIQIKNSVIARGSINVDKDIDYIYRVGTDKASKLKETFAVADSLYADNSEVIKIDDKEINQEEISRVVEARIREILEVSEKEIKNLTNRQISYIIVSGGLTEISGFNHLLEKVINKAEVLNLVTIGIRHNKFSSCYGAILYYDNKLSLRDKHYDMVDKEQFIQSLNIQEEKKEEKDNKNKRAMNKMFNFFGNKEDDL